MSVLLRATLSIHHMKQFNHLLFFVFVSACCYGQTGQLAVVCSQHTLRSGDTLFTAARYEVDGHAPPAATLFMKLVSEDGLVWQMRWPMVNGGCEPGLIIPPDMPEGNYKAFFTVQQTALTATGRVNTPDGLTKLKAVLVTNEGEWIQGAVPVDDSGRFVYRNQLFSGTALLSFQRLYGSNASLDITLETVLDSAFTPAAETVMVPLAVSRKAGLQPLIKPVIALPVPAEDVSFNSRAAMLQTVTVYGRRLSPAEKYEELYSRGLFRSSLNRQLIDVMNNPAAIASSNILQFLTTRVPGLLISGDGMDMGQVRWRGSNVVFYLDEVQTDIQMISSVPVSDVAFVKAFPPPFIGNFGNSGGAVVVYTRRGDFETNTTNRHVFKVKGYTPVMSLLTAMPPAE